MFDDILERKKAFLDFKKQKVKKVKNEIFPKGLVHGFGQKLENFPSFYFWQNQLAKCVSALSSPFKNHREAPIFRGSPFMAIPYSNDQ